MVTELNELKEVCKPVSSVEEGEEIGAQLLNELTKSGNGIGLAANQIGINKRVCVINVKEPLVLINPEIIERSEEKFVFLEGCLSFPDESIRTQRHKWVKVKADNHTSTMMFTVWNENNDEGYNTKDKLNYAYECACVQHEIDHLDGITMFDREWKETPWTRRTEKIGRNEKVTITNEEETKTIKWKKAQSLVESGGWKIVD